MYIPILRIYIILTRSSGDTAEEYVRAIAKREIACIERDIKLPRPTGIFNGPNSSLKLSVLQDFLKVVRYLLPLDSSALSSKIWHIDLHADNIFVHPERPSEIVGLIDWQSVHLTPLFLQARPPAFLDFSGPKPEGLHAFKLPENFSELSVQEQQDAKNLLSKQSLLKLYEVYSSLQNQ